VRSKHETNEVDRVFGSQLLQDIGPVKLYRAVADTQSVGGFPAGGAFTIWSRTARSRTVNSSRPRKGFEKIWLLSFNGFDFPMMRTLPVDSHKSVQTHRQYRSTGSDRPWQVSEITLTRLTQIQFGPGGTNYRPQRRAFCSKRASEAQL
jgi:hypothetical protein